MIIVSNPGDLSIRLPTRRETAKVAAFALSPLIKASAASGWIFWLDDDAAMLIAFACTMGGGGLGIFITGWFWFFFLGDGFLKRLARSALSVTIAWAVHAMLGSDDVWECAVAGAVYVWLGYWTISSRIEIAIAFGMIAATAYAVPLLGAVLVLVVAWTTKCNLMPTLTSVMTCGCSWFLSVLTWFALLAGLFLIVSWFKIDVSATLMVLTWIMGGGWEGGRYTKIPVQWYHALTAFVGFCVVWGTAAERYKSQCDLSAINS